MLILDTSTLGDKANSLSPSEVYWAYNGLDCGITFDVKNAIKPQLDEVSSLTYETSMATLAPVMEMMLEGLPVSLSRRREVEAYYVKRLEELENNFQKMLVDGLGLPADRALRKGRRPLAVNYASPKDVQYLFHTVLGIPEKKTRKKGQDAASVTTDRAALESFKVHYFAEPFVNFILAMRDCTKAIGFLGSPLDSDNHLRCSLNVAGTNTGRLSSSFSDTGTGTNLQNINGKMKDIFVAPDGWMFVDIDLEQGDSRGVGAIAWNWFVEEHGEEWAGRYLDACESGDLHTSVCKMAWPNLSWGDDPKGWKKIAQQIAYRDKTFRDLAKVLGHGTNYMGLANTMAKNSKLPVGTVSAFQRAYFEGFPCIREWQLRTLHLLKTQRCLITPWGRRRYFWNNPDANTTENAAIAYSPQSTTGEFINRGMIKLWHYRNAKNLPIKFLLQVHDSLVLLVREDRIEELMPIILKQLAVKLILARDREFTIPHGCKVGWNYGSVEYNKAGEIVGNHYGLKVWTGTETRKPPAKIKNFRQALETPLGQMR